MARIFISEFQALVKFYLQLYLGGKGKSAEEFVEVLMNVLRVHSLDFAVSHLSHWGYGVYFTFRSQYSHNVHGHSVGFRVFTALSIKPF